MRIRQGRRRQLLDDLQVNMTREVAAHRGSLLASGAAALFLYACWWLVEEPPTVGRSGVVASQRSTVGGGDKLLQANISVTGTQWAQALEASDSKWIFYELLAADNEGLLALAEEAYRAGFIQEAREALEAALRRPITTDKTAIAIAELLTTDSEVVDPARLRRISADLAQRLQENQAQVSPTVDVEGIKSLAVTTVLQRLSDAGVASRSEGVLQFVIETRNEAPTDRRISEHLAVAYADRGDLQSALRVIESIPLASGTDSDSIKALRAQFNYRLGNIDEAIRLANELRAAESSLTHSIDNIPFEKV